MTKKQKNIVFQILMVAGAIIYIIWANIYDRARTRKYYDYYYQKNLKGLITGIERNQHTMRIKLDNKKEEYKAMDSVNAADEVLDYHVDVGDSFIKPAYADSIVIVKKNGKRHVFPLHKKW